MAVLVYSQSTLDDPSARAGDLTLTWAEVRAIRRWALANPHLSEATCINVLRQTYHVSAGTMWSVVANTSRGWFDEGYRPASQRPEPVTRVQSPANNVVHRRARDHQLQLIRADIQRSTFMPILTKVAVGLMLLFLAAPVSAQTHPCDSTPAPIEVRPGVPFAAGWCFDLTDTSPERNPITVDGYKLLLNPEVDPVTKLVKPNTGTVLPNPGPAAKSATANSSGQYYFQTPKTITLADGSYVLAVVLTGKGGDGLPSAPFPLVSRTLPPGSPSALRLVK